MRSRFNVGKTIAGFAYTISKQEGETGRMLMHTFSKTQEMAKAKLVNSPKYFFSVGNGHYRLFSIHLTVMQELDPNLGDDTLGFPSLDGDETPRLNMLNGRIVLEDNFELVNPITTTRRQKRGQ